MANSPRPRTTMPTPLALVGLALLCAASPCRAGGANVASVVTDAFFNSIKSRAANCPGKSFYTRSAFLSAVDAYPGFAQGGSEAEGKREIAAFFAHVTHETGHMCTINENGGAKRNYCDATNKQWPCYRGKKYYGRGPLQISWNYNYGPAGQSIGFDGLKDPGRVARDAVVSFKTALWFWMANVHRVMPQGFGATIRAINGELECDGKNTAEMNDRVNNYLQYCKRFGVDPGSNLTC